MNVNNKHNQTKFVLFMSNKHNQNQNQIDNV